MRNFAFGDGPLLAAWLGLCVAAAGCGGAADESDAGKADAAARGADARDVPIRRACTSATVWGTIAPSAGTLTTTVPAAYFDLPWSSSERPASGLRVDVDRAEAETLDGRAVECTRRDGYHYCKDSAGLRSLRVFVGAESFSEEIYYQGGDCISFIEGDLAGRTQMPIALAPRACVEPETVVVEGALRNFAEDAPVMVWLVGERQPVIDPESNLAYTPYRPCDVVDQRYRCTTLGYDATVAHVLKVRQDGQRQSQTVSLQVDACQVQPLQLDLQRPAGDAGTP